MLFYQGVSGKYFAIFTSRDALKREIAGKDPVTSVEYVGRRRNSRCTIGRLKFSDTGDIAYIACTEKKPARLFCRFVFSDTV